MGGTGDPVEEHRAWWSSLVSSAAYAPRIPLRGDDAAAAAPVAALTAALGPSSASESRPDLAGGAELILKTLFIIALVALVLETALRRLGGKP
jgi:hypothetical protein